MWSSFKLMLTLLNLTLCTAGIHSFILGTLFFYLKKKMQFIYLSSCVHLGSSVNIINKYFYFECTTESAHAIFWHEEQEIIHRKWHIFLENDCVYCQSSFVCCIMSCFPRLCWLDRYMPGWAFGWAGQRWLSFWGHIPAAREGGPVGCGLAPLLPLFLLECVSPSMIDVLRTWLVFHLQPASQLSTEPPAQMHQHILLSKTCQLLRGYVLFGEFKGWCITCPRPLYESPLPAEFIPFCLFHFYMLGGNSRDAGFTLFMPFVSLYCSQRYYK